MVRGLIYLLLKDFREISKAACIWDPIKMLFGYGYDLK